MPTVCLSVCVSVSVYLQDEYSNLVQEWNRQRSMALERALLRILYPLMARELKAKLLEEAKQSIIRVNVSLISLNTVDSSLLE